MKRRIKVKPIKMFGLAALAALMAMAFVGASSAMAENTQLCTADENPCAHAVTSVHETGKIELLTSPLNVECDVLFASTSVGAEGAPQIIKGHFTYSNCNPINCSVTEVSKIAKLEVLRLGHETADITYNFEIHVECSGFFNCTYDGENLKATAKGALLSTQANGEVTISGEETHRVSGIFCSEKAFLDLTTTGLTKTYIK
jgi:hypothetical protein